MAPDEGGFELAEAERIALRWVNQGRPADDRWPVAVQEFDVGYLVWPQPPPGAAEAVGAGRGVIDKRTGELSVWPSLPLDEVLRMYRDDRARRIPPPRTWDMATQTRRDLTREPFPAHVTHLTLADGHRFTGRATKGAGEPRLHPLVREFLDGLPPEARERGAERCSEVAALSDVLHAEDSGRAADHRPAVTLEEARGAVFSGGDLVTYLVREPDDPRSGLSTVPCLSCYQLLQHFGFRLQEAPELPSPGGEDADG